MTDVRRVPSAEFRVIYHRLEEPVDVTVLGRAIGRWTPVGSAPRSVHPEPEAATNHGDRAVSPEAPSEREPTPASTGAGGQSEAPGHGGAAPSASRSEASWRGPATAPARRSIQQTLDRAAKEGRNG